jgi:Heavy metal binding domain
MKRVVLISLMLLAPVAALAQTGPPQYDVIPPGGLWGPVRGASPASPATTPTLPLAPAPRSTADMATVNPTITLIIDDHDTPTAIAVAEANRSNTTPPEQHDHQTTRQSENQTTTHQHQHHHPATEQPSNPATTKATPKPRKPATTKPTPATPKPAPAVTIYTCPMHPEVTSDKPGNCPKCGMSLVKRAPKK